MQKKIQFPRRAESLNIYKAPKSLQLPRFHSRPKNSILPSNKNSNGGDSQPSSNNNQLKNSIKLNKNQLAQIVTKIKQKKYASKSKQKKQISQKKITAFNKCDSEGDQKQKFVQKLNQNCLEVKGENLKQQISQRQSSVASNQKNQPKKFTQFRSKSLKNAIKYIDSGNPGPVNSVTNRQNSGKYHQKMIKIEIKKKNSTQQAVQKRKNPREDEKMIVQYNSQITTEATQPNVSCQMDKKIWKKIVQLFMKITLQPDNLDWPQQYIVMDKQVAQKKLYQILDQNANPNLNIKSKVRKHICITRICIYLYCLLILHQTDTKSVLPIFNKLHENFVIIAEIVSNGLAGFGNDKSAAISRNNQLNTKLLSKMLSKKSMPHQNLLKNMLQSSLKIQSTEFIDILDKTLKWQILKMPSYPYLPPASKDLHLVLDLDQTLIHYDYNAELFHVRPFAEQFLKKASNFFEITIFTAALQEYADQILNQIDGEHCISYKLYRNHLTYIDGVPLKDLSMLGRPLNKTIIVDNIAANYRLQPENGVLIRSWYDDDNDEALGKLYGFLLKIVQSYKHDVRLGIRQLSQFIKEQITKPQLIYQLPHQL